VQPGYTVGISHLTITQGYAASGYGGGISNEGTLSLTDVVVTGNSAGLAGGGIENFAGSLTLTNTTVTNNSAPSGGGIDNQSTNPALTVNQSTVNNNFAGGDPAASAGGGISNSGSGSQLSLTNSTVSGNIVSTTGGAVAEGGGIADLGSSTTISLNNTIVSNNSVTASGSYARGGGFDNSANGGTVSITNSTFAGNSVNGAVTFASGGGLNFDGSVTASLTNDTISGNATSGASPAGGGVLAGGRSAVNLNFVTLDGNSATSGSAVHNTSGSGLSASNSIISGAPSTNCSGVITDGGYNLDSGASCAFSGTGDLSGVDPLLGALQNNGGPTPTEAPSMGSPAIDAANPGCPPPATDQRGANRPFGVSASRCDMGAVEYGATPPAGSGVSTLTLTGQPVKGRSEAPLTAEVATFTDSNPTGNPADYTASISWGDGHHSAGQVTATSAGGTISGTNTYSYAGTYTIRITLTKDDGASASTTTTATILTHFHIELKGWIPQAQVVDPFDPFDAWPYAFASRTEGTCLTVPPSLQSSTTITARFLGDNHGPYAGSFRALGAIDFDWDGTSLLNVTPANPMEGFTHRLQIYSIAGKGARCMFVGHAPTSGISERQSGGPAFELGICCASGKDPLVSSAPSFHAVVDGLISSQDELSYTFDSSGFPSIGVQVTRDGTLADTNTLNDANCLSQSDVLGVPAIGKLAAGFSVIEEGDEVIVPANLAGSVRTDALSDLCSQAAAYDASHALSNSPGSAAISSSMTGLTSSVSTTASSTSSKLRTRSAGPSGGSGGTTGTITGTVTDLSGHPLAGICASVLTAPGVGAGTETTTTSKGTYTVSGISPGIYQVRFEDCAGGNHLTQWYNGQAVQATASSLVVSAGSTISGVNAKLGTGGTISGIVTNSSGSALANICVHAQDSRGHFADALATGSSGSYSVGGLPAGNYLVSFTPCPAANYVSQYYNGASTPDGATLVAVGASGNTSSINATLVTGSSISGTVTDAAGVALSNMCVYAIGSSGGIINNTTTSSSGGYVLNALAAGSYRVQFSDCTGGNHLTQFWNARSDPNLADVIKLATAGSASGINASLAAGGRISGTITNSSGTALAGACAAASPAAGGPAVSASAPTSSTGVYTIPALASGTYDVEFFDCSGGNHAPQWYQSQPNEASATAVTVTAGGTVSGVNGALSTGGSISGTVTANGSPVLNACVVVNDSSGNQVGAGATDASGNYTVSGLPSGTDTVGFSDCFASSHVPQWYNGQPDATSATGVTVTAGSTTSGINANLTITGAISGIVTNASNAPLQDICVSAQPVGGGSPTSATSDPTGAYTVANLPPGNYLVDFNSCTSANAGFEHEWYPNGFSASTATPISVSANTTTGGINASLGTGGSISGTVTDTAAVALPNICVIARPASSSIAPPHAAITNAAGQYSLPGLASGTYSVAFSDCLGGPHLSQYFNGQPDGSTATMVQMTAPSQVLAINAQLATGGTISGTVTDLASGTPLEGICVDAFGPGASAPLRSAFTDARGSYHLGPLAGGSYNVDFVDCAGGGHTTQWANGQASQATATTITVSAGGSTGNVNAQLSS
jgi:hypothetical protein